MDLKGVPLPDSSRQHLLMIAQCLLGLFQLGPDLIPLGPGMLLLLLGVKDVIIVAPHHLIGLLKLVLALGKVLPALGHCADSLLVLHL